MKIIRPESKQKMPEDARKVFSGKIFDVYQWEQEMFDGTVSIFEKLKRPDTVVVFGVRDDGKIILTKQEQPGKKTFIGGAGGRVDPGEDILEAAKREFLEEAGYEASEYVLWQATQPTSKIDWAVFVFIAKGLREVSPQKLDAGEKIEVYPVTFGEFLKIALDDDFSEIEIQREVALALLDEEKMLKLKALFAFE